VVPRPGRRARRWPPSPERCPPRDATGSAARDRAAASIRFRKGPGRATAADPSSCQRRMLRQVKEGSAGNSQEVRMLGPGPQIPLNGNLANSHPCGAAAPAHWADEPMASCRVLRR
jgi:hypothetical protein